MFDLEQRQKIEMLADLPIAELRQMVYDSDSSQSTSKEADEMYRNWSRGQLMAKHLENENE